MKKIVVVILMLVMTVLLLASCGDAVTVQKTYVNDEFHLIVEYSDGTSEDLGYVGTTDESKNVTVTKSYVNEELHAIVEYSNGTSKDLGYVGVVDESKNVTVTKSYINEELHAIVEYSNGTSKDLGYVGVVDESKNVTVTKSYVNEELHAIVEYSNGTSKDLGYVGVVDESKNVTVTKNYVNEELHVIVEYSNGTSKDLGYVGVVDESKNVTVTKSYVNEELHAIVEYSNGTSKDLGYVGVVDESKNVIVTNTYVNEEKHLIVEYSNGTSEDLGYVGVEVEVEPPLYTVTFLDINGTVISTQEVYKGKSAKAPTAPDVTDKVFSGWDTDYTNVQGHLTIRALYVNAAEYTVTFKDELGNTLKTQIVISGHAATAPTPPTRADKIFTGWDKSFSYVTEDITVTAQYRAKNTYTVTFKDYSGLVLATVDVKEGDTATAPVTPTREGYNFTGWSATLNNITSNKTVTAKYSMKSGSNIIDISYTLSTNNTVVVTFAVKGGVKFCGLEGNVSVPSGFTYKSHVESNGTLANYVAADGKLYFTMTSNNGQNLTSETTLMTVTFSYTSAVSTASLTTNIVEIFDQTGAFVNYSVIGEEIKVK